MRIPPLVLALVILIKVRILIQHEYHLLPFPLQRADHSALLRGSFRNQSLVIPCRLLSIEFSITHPLVLKRRFSRVRAPLQYHAAVVRIVEGVLAEYVAKEISVAIVAIVQIL